MKGWRVYFEFYGRQMVTEVEARNQHEAKERVKERIVFLKVKEVAVEAEPDSPADHPLPPPKEGKGKTIMDFIYGFRKF